MRTWLAVAVAALVVASFPARPVRAEQSLAVKLSDGLLTWFQHVKEGLAESSVSGRRQHARITAVAAVRGAEQDSEDPAKPVWKSAAAGKRSKALKAQRAELSAAVDAVLAGKLDEGRAKLDAFEKAHPDSPMLADAKEIRGKLDEARKDQDAVAKTDKGDKPKKAAP